jgi:transcriptional regulator with XRE-family HTH domain
VKLIATRMPTLTSDQPATTNGYCKFKRNPNVPATGRHTDPTQDRLMKRDLKGYVGQALRVARKQRSLTQEDLAGRVRRPPESISKLERGHGLPSLELLFELSSELQIPAAELFEGFEPRRKVPKERSELEMRLRQTIKDLSPKALKLASALIKAASDHEGGG